MGINVVAHQNSKATCRAMEGTIKEWEEFKAEKIKNDPNATMWTNTQISTLAEIKRRLAKDSKEGRIHPETWIRKTLQKLIERMTALQTVLELEDPEEHDEVYKSRSAILLKQYEEEKK